MKRSDKQRENAKEWGSFIIHGGPAPEKKFFKKDAELAKQRRKAREKHEEIQERRKLREVWE